MSGTGAPRLSAYLAFALLLRLPAVLWCHGYEFQDAQYQYVDPAYHLAYDAAWNRTWEWQDGVRSWFYPALLAGVFRLVDSGGALAPLELMTFVRGLHAVVSLLPLAALWLCITRWRPVPRPRPVLLLAAVAGPMVYVGVQPNGPAFAGMLSLAAGLLAMSRHRTHCLCAGLLVGVAFACRFQDALFGFGIAVVQIALRQWRALAWFLIGAGAMVAVQGFVDLVTWGGFLHSPLAYLEFNVMSGASARFGVEPPWFYLPFVVGGLLLWPPFLRRSIAALADGARGLPHLFVAAAIYLVIHSLIGRKAARFVVPAFLMLGLVYATGLLGSPARDWIDRLQRRLFLALNLCAWLFLSTHWFNRGPIEAALALRAEPTFQRQLLVVDGQVDSIGGYLYLDRQQLQVVPVRRGDLDDWLDDRPAEAPFFAMALREPLERTDLPPGWSLEELGEFTDWPELRLRSRRYVYRITP
jgi:hypothetical protein